MPLLLAVFMDMLSQYVTLVSVLRWKNKHFEFAVAWTLSLLFAMLLVWLGLYEVFLNFGMAVIVTVYLLVKTRNLTLSLLFSAVMVIINRAADHIAIPIVYYVFGQDMAGFRAAVLDTGAAYTRWHLLVQGLTVVLSIILGRFLKSKLSVLVTAMPKSGVARFILGGTLITLGLFYANIFFVGRLHHLQEGGMALSGEPLGILVPVLLIGYMIFLVAAAHAFVRHNNAVAEIAQQKDLLDSLARHTEGVEEMYAEMRRFRHGYVNILASVNGYVQDGDLENLRAFLAQQLTPYGKSFTHTGYTLDRLSLIALPELKGLLSFKCLQAREKGVQTHIEIDRPVARADMNRVDLCRVAGILLDNAIDACAGTHGVLRFSALAEEAGVLFLFANTAEPPADLSSLFRKGFSTKGKGRGLGLYNAREIVGRYPNAALSVRADKKALDGTLLIFELYVGNIEE